MLWPPVGQPWKTWSWRWRADRLRRQALRWAGVSTPTPASGCSNSRIQSRRTGGRLSPKIGNATLRELHLDEDGASAGGMRFGRDLAAVVNRVSALRDLHLWLWQERDVEEVRQVLSPLLTNPASTLTSLFVRIAQEGWSEAVVVVTAEALLQTPSTKLESLRLWHVNDRFTVNERFSVIKAPVCEKVAEMLRSNTALKSLCYPGYELQGSAIVDAMSENHRLGLEDLSLRLDPAGATALFLLLTPPEQMPGTALAPSAATVALPHLRTLSVWHCKGYAKALARMLQGNTTLVKLYLYGGGYSREEWGEILPALKSNTTLESLHLTFCEGVDEEVVYKVITDLLRENTTIREINVDGTPLERAGKAEAITQAIRRNVEYRAALADLPKCLPNQVGWCCADIPRLVKPNCCSPCGVSSNSS